MASIEELKRRIDLHSLAERLGLEKGPGGDKALYKSPHHSDKHASLSIFVNHPKSGTGWKDHSADQGGSCIDLVMYVRDCTVGEAMKYLHEEFNIPFDKKEEPEQKRQKSTLDYIADRCEANREKVREYLQGRGISDEAIDVAMRAKTIGFNEWTSDTKKSGEVGYGGPGAAFIVRSPSTAQVAAVDMRFVDPSLNGDVKTQTHGDKDGIGWTADPRKLAAAKIVVLVESSINALSVDTARLPMTAAFSIRGIGNVGLIDFGFLRGKQVVICMDNDKPIEEGKPRAGHRPGPEAAWALYDRLTALNISAVMVDQGGWIEAGENGQPGDLINDVNDYLKLRGPDGLAKALTNYEPWIIPGMSGEAKQLGKRRVFLPTHDYSLYWKFRNQVDFTRYITRMEEATDDKPETPRYDDLCGFRIASLSRVSVSGVTSTMTGDPDQSPTVYFAVTVQTPRHGANLTRKVLVDEQLHNTQQWAKFGPIWKPAEFSRMVNILERTAHLGERTAINFVGLAWRNGELTVNEGPDCYFTDAKQQCPYHNLTFPSGAVQDARTVIRAYQSTFLQNAAAIPLVWALGGHMKALLGFWPHMTIQADKSAGKSTLIKRLERTLAFKMFSGQSLQTEFRLLTSISHTSHPVGWEELSARDQKTIDKAVGMLQENYQYTVTSRGADMTEYLLSAPVMLAGEDVPVQSLLGKIIRTNLTGKKGPMMPDNLPRFPVRQWLQFLSKLDKMAVLEKYAELRDYCVDRSQSDEDGAKRMAGNYAAVLLAWRYLAEFAGMDHSEGYFGRDLLTEMNLHLTESNSERAPWVWIMRTALSEIDAGNYKHPYAFASVDGEECLLLRTSHVIDHLSTSTNLRQKWDSSPVKSALVFKRQLAGAKVIVGDKEIEKTIHTRRVAHLTPISLKVLASFGLSVAVNTMKGE